MAAGRDNFTKLLEESMARVLRENERLRRLQEEKETEKKRSQDNYNFNNFRQLNDTKTTKLGERGGDFDPGSYEGPGGYPSEPIDVGGFEGPGGAMAANGGGEVSGASSSSAAGSGGAAMAGYVGAAILAQHIMSNNTDTEVEGVKTDDIFDGHVMTEPWLGFANDKLGIDPSSGEKFDASVENSDWGKAAKRLPAAMLERENPPAAFVSGAAKKYLGEDVAGIFNPLSWLFDKLGE